MVAGITGSCGAGELDVLLIKTNSLGNTPPLGVTDKESKVLPQAITLSQNYPNPFNPVSTIRYDLPKGSVVSLIIYDILGRKIIRLVDGYMEPGYHQIQWDGRDQFGRELPSGIYLARLLVPPTAGMTVEYAKAIKMVLLK